MNELRFSRAQITAAKEALGVSRDDTRMVSIYPGRVYVERVARDEAGQPIIREGLVAYEEVMVEIDEEEVE